MTPTTLAEGVEEFLASLRAESGSAPNTIEAYRRDLRQYLAFLDGRDPTPEDVEAFAADMARRGLAPSTHRRKMAAVRGLHRFLVGEGWRQEDPTVLVQMPARTSTFPKALDVDETIRLIESPDVSTVAGRRDSALLEFLYASGARVSEAVEMNLTDLDLDDMVATVTGKGSKQRVVPIGGPAATALERWLPDRLRLVRRQQRGDPLFINLRGGRLSRQGIFDIVRRHSNGAGIDAGRVSPHVLRHSAATHMVEAGADLRTVQELLGHATISTTQVYTRVSSAHILEIYLQAHPRSR